MKKRVVVYSVASALCFGGALHQLLDKSSKIVFSPNNKDSALTAKSPAEAMLAEFESVVIKSAEYNLTNAEKNLQATHDASYVFYPDEEIAFLNNQSSDNLNRSKIINSNVIADAIGSFDHTANNITIEPNPASFTVSPFPISTNNSDTIVIAETPFPIADYKLSALDNKNAENNQPSRLKSDVSEASIEIESAASNNIVTKAELDNSYIFYSDDEIAADDNRAETSTQNNAQRMFADLNIENPLNITPTNALDSGEINEAPLFADTETSIDNAAATHTDTDTGFVDNNALELPSPAINYAVTTTSQRLDNIDTETNKNTDVENVETEIIASNIDDRLATTSNFKDEVEDDNNIGQSNLDTPAISAASGNDENSPENIVTASQNKDATHGTQAIIPLPNSNNDVSDEDSNTVETSASQESASAGTAVQQIPLGEHGRPDINPYDRDIDLTVPITFQNRSLGDIPLFLTADDRFLLSAKVFIQLMRPVLNEPAHETLANKLESFKRFGPDDLSETGVSLVYDPNSLSVVVVEVSPEQRAIENLFAPPRDDVNDVTIDPAKFSAYLNLRATQTHVWESGDYVPPLINFDGAVRVGKIVFEGDAQFSQNLGAAEDGYELSRNFARFVYDEPEKYRRWFLGDLDPEIRGQQAFVSIGGLGVVRQQRRFNSFRAAILQANRQLVVQRESTVRFLRNGALFREIRLQPGVFDFSALPLTAGSNDIDIQVTDNSGAVQNLSYQQYLDPIDLDPGDHEYGAYIGPTSNSFGRAPDYDGPLAFTGFYRKAFFDKPAIGVGLQASKDVQTFTGQTQFVLKNGGRLLLDGGFSNSDVSGQGYTAGVSYEHFIDRRGLSDSLTIRGDYISNDFSTLNNIQGINTTSYTATAQYTRQFSQKFLTTASASYLRGREELGDSYRIGVNSFYRIHRRWTMRFGIDYAKFPSATTLGNGLSLSFGIVFQPNFRRRAEARYESRDNIKEVSYNQSGINQLNNLGFGAVVTDQRGNSRALGFAAYSANRFDTSVSHASFGPSISDFGAVNATSVSVGTTIATADGSFGVGRRINDSFALLKPHENLKGRKVVAGQSLARNNFIGKSGPLGSALNNFLGSYATQSIQYDVEDPPVGYDTGSGIHRVYPSYRSGYSIEIGTEAFVSALGTLILAEDQPVSLIGGRVTILDLEESDDLEPIPFFTNSVGRFAIANLLPGRKYLVETYGANGSINQSFEFSVPEDTEGLVNLGVVRPGDRK